MNYLNKVKPIPLMLMTDEKYKIYCHKETSHQGFPLSILKYRSDDAYDKVTLTYCATRKEQKQLATDLSEFFEFPIEVEPNK